MKRKQSKQDDDYFVCPHCGAEVRCGATVCHECGASDDAGWGDSHDASVDELEDDFDYDDFVRREFPRHATTARIGSFKVWFTAIIVLLLCVALLTMW